MARESLTEHIAFIRRYGQAAYDEEFAGQTYWDDDQLEDISDTASVRTYTYLKPANIERTKFRVLLPKGQKIENDFTVYNSSAVAVSTPATYDFNLNEITFDSAVAEDDYTVGALVVNLWEALADLWQQKANMRFDYIDWKAQNNKMNMKQEYDHCVERALYYRAKTIRSFKRNGHGKWWSA